MRRALRKLWILLRYGKPTSHVIGTVGSGIAAEIEYRDRGGRVIAFWAYGSWEPGSKYHGEFE